MAISGLVTRKFRAHNAAQLFESFSETSPTRYFVYIGKVNAWSDDSNPPTPDDTIQNITFDIYRSMMALKRVQASDVSYVVSRYNWTTNTTYKQYTHDDASLYPTSTDLTSNTTFYVLTDDNNVYKCIDNNRGGRSTTKPTGTSPSIVSTADGYRWKFLYTLSSADRQKFLSSSYIPVQSLSSNNGSAQWVVQSAAANGSIEHVNVDSMGSGYLSTSNTFASVTNSTSLVLNTNASQADGVYVGSSIYLNGGLGSGQLRRIIRYAGSTRTATVNTAFATTPNTGTSYIVSPSILIRGDSGATTTTRATAYVSNAYGGYIRKVTMITPGKNYSFANAVIVCNTSFGSGASLRPIISPYGGHGSNPVRELAARSLMLTVQVAGAESNTFPTNNDFRMIGLIADPVLRSGPVANASVIDQCTRVTVTSLTGALTSDEVIVGGTSGAKGLFVRFANTNSSGTQGMIRLINVTPNGTGGIFSVGEQISGQSSGVNGTVTAVTRPAIREFTGNIIYTENRSPVSRATDQIENVKLVVKF